MADPIGIEAKGRAGVFGSGTNPLAVYLQNEAYKQKRAQALYDQERDQRDKLVDDLRKFNPDQVWNPFNEEVNQYVQKNVRDRFSELRAQRQPLPAIDREMQRAQGEANTLVAKINWLKDQHKEAMDTLDSNDVGKYYKNSQTKRAVNDVFFNGRVAKPSSEINADQIQEAFDNPDNFDVNAIATDFMKSLPEKVNQKYTEYWGKYGQNYDVTETKTKLGIQMQRGADGRDYAVIDPRTGLPKISMTDEVYLQAMENDYLNKVVNKYVPNGTIPQQKEFLTGLLEGLDPATIQSRPQMGFRRPDDEIRYNAYGRGFRMPIADLEDRYNWANTVTKEYRPDQLARASNPDSDEQAYYGDKEGKPIHPGQKPESIVLARVGVKDRQESGLNASAKNFEETLAELLLKGRVIKESVIPITTEEGQRQAMIALSNRLDKIDAKRSIGPDEFGNFVEAKYQDRLKKNKNTKSGIQWKK